MRICFIAVELFAWGKYGGFGRATRVLGRELAARGHDVFAVVPCRPGQGPVEKLDGMTVLAFPPWKPWRASGLLRECDAEIYHSCEPSFTSYLALRALPQRKHMVTCRDPRELYDWWLEYRRPSLNKFQVLHNFLYEDNWLVRRSMRRMDAVYTTGKYLIPKVRRMYRLAQDPVFLPTPVRVPQHVQKASRPTVCYMARLDPRKRPEMFFELAKRFPNVRFVVAGRSRNPKWEAALRASYANLPNLELLGFIDQFISDAHSQLLAQSWIMVNTAAREGLPNSFIEAAAHRCAILSAVDPDGFASQFGFHAASDRFTEGLAWLLEQDRWRTQGERGWAYVLRGFELEAAMRAHLAAYEALLRPRAS